MRTHLKRKWTLWVWFTAMAHECQGWGRYLLSRRLNLFQRLERSQPGSNVQAITSEVPCIPGVHSMACCQRPGPISHPRSAVILTEIHCLVGSSCCYKKEIVWGKRSDLCLYWEFWPSTDGQPVFKAYFLVLNGHMHIGISIIFVKRSCLCYLLFTNLVLRFANGGDLRSGDALVCAAYPGRQPRSPQACRHICRYELLHCFLGLLLQGHLNSPR